MKNHQPQLTVTIPIHDKQGHKIGERQVATFAGLLARAHEEGLRCIDTALIQVPTKENGSTAVVRAVVRTNRGDFSGIGDANPTNVNARIANHLIRLAETRAKARALRDAVNIACVAIEELDELLDEVRDVAAQTVPSVTATPRSPAGDAPMTDAQRRMLFRLASQRGIAPENVRSWLESQLEVHDVKAISRAEASRFIERLQSNNGAAHHADVSS